MASAPSQERSAKPSFAKIAAMAPPTKLRGPPAIQAKNGPVPKEIPPLASAPAQSLAASVANVTGPQSDISQPRNDVHGISSVMAGLSVAEPALIGAHNRTQEKGSMEKTASTFEDDQSHLSNSSTKPTSLSLASITTLAMDEKESLRPDDSASVQAAEEEDSLSGAASGAANSQAGSDASMRPFRDQYREISDTTGGSIPRSSTTAASVSNIPRFNDGGLQLSVSLPQGSAPTQIVPLAPPSFGNGPPPLPLEPDEKLLEAMGTPKDRLLLLQYEEKIISFIQTSKEESLDLPPCNSFGRLLAHKLADYYHMTHCVTEDNATVASVRVFRTPFSRLPPPLSVLQSPHATNTPPPTGTAAFKIMRRAGLTAGKASNWASTAASSFASSKATSESGGDDPNREGTRSPPTDGILKDKATLTMEQKQAKYQAARERIFGDFQETNTTETSTSADNSGDMSRSSSSSGKKKGHKQRMPKDDSFEARSQFNVWYPGMQFQTGVPQYNGTPTNLVYPPFYPTSPGGGMPLAGFQSTPGQPFLGYEGQTPPSNMAGYSATTQPQYGQNLGWQNGQSPQHAPYPTFVSGNHPAPVMSQHSSNKSSPSTSHFVQPVSQQYQAQSQQWLSSPYQSAYQQAPMQRSPPPVHWPNFPQPSVASASVPYQYGELPDQQYNPGILTSTNQHPIPGSFNRSTFNPQTRSFVPGGGLPARHASKSRALGLGGPTGAAADVYTGAHVLPSATQPSYIHRISSSSPAKNIPSPPASNQDSIQKKWGTPDHLPKKPPPSEVPSAFNIGNTPPLPSQQAYPNLSGNLGKGGPLIVSGTTPALKMTGGLAAGS